MDQKEFERDVEAYEIAGLFNGLASEISLMGFDLSTDNLQLLSEKLNRWQTMLSLVKSKIEEIQIDKILNDD